ncbi:hemolysin family protein [Actinomycetospora cinnamomea]|uniref:CBS domain containing-hemolysin-like protein n=1 Tax=Actinomycetospora cinnamomea TaxID=663609 RepID=A0A2U1EU37_9PSEU|nr:hemolysin family protein [Actinomycetospora cinnamomea]PVZ03448.1 CBS domain containing-hemolysin-like protein [Actinomycetospora cinnamomea]
MNDYVALLLMIALLLANAFFVGAEFSLISARRDRLEALLAEGTAGAGTVLRASEHLSMMLAAAQLGITICSLALGSLGEPAVAHQLEAVLEPLGVPTVLTRTISFVIALIIVTILHIVIGEMVPKNIAIAGPERTSLWLVPPLVAFLKVTRPVITVLNWVANHFLRLFGVTPVDERESAYTPQEIAEMLSESRREGLLDASQTRRLTQALSSAEHTVADVMIPLERVTVLPPNPTVGAVEEAVARTGFSRFPVQAPEAPDAHPRLDTHATEPGTTPITPSDDAPDHAPVVALDGYLHVKDVLDLGDDGDDGDDGDHAVPADRVRALPELALTAPVDEALAALRREGSHLARAVDDQGATVGLVAMEDLVEEYVGTVRDSTHVTRPVART